ncbi:MAG: hypothetical protein GY830_06905 [Bacteroidetes bacterium]|nr:hypothetical protein [Bacteroidota bacterium]
MLSLNIKELLTSKKIRRALNLFIILNISILAFNCKNSPSNEGGATPTNNEDEKGLYSLLGQMKDSSKKDKAQYIKKGVYDPSFEKNGKIDKSAVQAFMKNKNMKQSSFYQKAKQVKNKTTTFNSVNTTIKDEAVYKVKKDNVIPGKKAGDDVFGYELREGINIDNASDIFNRVEKVTNSSDKKKSYQSALTEINNILNKTPNEGMKNDEAGGHKLDSLDISMGETLVLVLRQAQQFETKRNQMFIDIEKFINDTNYDEIKVVDGKNFNDINKKTDLYIYSNDQLKELLGLLRKKEDIISNNKLTGKQLWTKLETTLNKPKYSKLKETKINKTENTTYAEVLAAESKQTYTEKQLRDILATLNGYIVERNNYFRDIISYSTKTKYNNIEIGTNLTFEQISDESDLYKYSNESLLAIYNKLKIFTPKQDDEEDEDDEDDEDDDYSQKIKTLLLKPGNEIFKTEKVTIKGRKYTYEQILSDAKAFIDDELKEPYDNLNTKITNRNTIISQIQELTIKDRAKKYNIFGSTKASFQYVLDNIVQYSYGQLESIKQIFESVVSSQNSQGGGGGNNKIFTSLLQDLNAIILEKDKDQLKYFFKNFLQNQYPLKDNYTKEDFDNIVLLTTLISDIKAHFETEKLIYNSLKKLCDFITKNKSLIKKTSTKYKKLLSLANTPSSNLRKKIVNKLDIDESISINDLKETTIPSIQEIEAIQNELYLIILESLGKEEAATILYSLIKFNANKKNELLPTLLENKDYKDLVVDTFKSTIGKADWLEMLSKWTYEDKLKTKEGFLEILEKIKDQKDKTGILRIEAFIQQLRSKITRKDIINSKDEICQAFKDVLEKFQEYAKDDKKFITKKVANVNKFLYTYKDSALSILKLTMDEHFSDKSILNSDDIFKRGDTVYLNKTKNTFTWDMILKTNVNNRTDVTKGIEPQDLLDIKTVYKDSATRNILEDSIFDRTSAIKTALEALENLFTKFKANYNSIIYRRKITNVKLKEIEEILDLRVVTNSAVITDKTLGNKLFKNKIKDIEGDDIIGLTRGQPDNKDLSEDAILTFEVNNIAPVDGKKYGLYVYLEDTKSGEKVQIVPCSTINALLNIYSAIFKVDPNEGRALRFYIKDITSEDITFARVVGTDLSTMGKYINAIDSYNNNLTVLKNNLQKVKTALDNFPSEKQEPPQEKPQEKPQKKPQEKPDDAIGAIDAIDAPNAKTYYTTQITNLENEINDLFIEPEHVNKDSDSFIDIGKASPILNRILKEAGISYVTKLSDEKKKDNKTDYHPRQILNNILNTDSKKLRNDFGNQGIKDLKFKKREISNGVFIDKRIEATRETTIKKLDSFKKLDNNVKEHLLHGYLNKALDPVISFIEKDEINRGFVVLSSKKSVRNIPNKIYLPGTLSSFAGNNTKAKPSLIISLIQFAKVENKNDLKKSVLTETIRVKKEELSSMTDEQLKQRYKDLSYIKHYILRFVDFIGERVKNNKRSYQKN